MVNVAKEIVGQTRHSRSCCLLSRSLPLGIFDLGWEAPMWAAVRPQMSLARQRIWTVVVENENTLSHMDGLCLLNGGFLKACLTITNWLNTSFPILNQLYCIRGISSSSNIQHFMCCLQDAPVQWCPHLFHVHLRTCCRRNLLAAGQGQVSAQPPGCPSSRPSMRDVSFICRHHCFQHGYCKSKPLLICKCAPPAGAHASTCIISLGRPNVFLDVALRPCKLCCQLMAPSDLPRLPKNSCAAGQQPVGSSWI